MSAGRPPFARREEAPYGGNGASSVRFGGNGDGKGPITQKGVALRGEGRLWVLPQGCSRSSLTAVNDCLPCSSCPFRKFHSAWIRS
jgi:hypothetical protein